VRKGGGNLTTQKEHPSPNTATPAVPPCSAGAPPSADAPRALGDCQHTGCSRAAISCAARLCDCPCPPGPPSTAPCAVPLGTVLTLLLRGLRTLRLTARSMLLGMLARLGLGRRLLLVLGLLLLLVLVLVLLLLLLVLVLVLLLLLFVLLLVQ